MSAEVHAETVLVVEDDLGVATLERRRLERAGYRVLHAPTAPETMALLRRERVSLILLDHRLPGGVEGLALYEQIKADGHDIPVIVVTGSRDETTVIQALRSGIRDYISKTAQYLDYLPTAVGRVLRQVSLERELLASKAHLAGIVGSALDAILTATPDGRITLFNPAAERLFCCAAAEALGQPLDRFLPGLEGEGGSAVGVRAGGERFPIEVSMARTTLDGASFHTLICRDVTDRRRADEERQRLLARQKQLEIESKLVFSDRMASIGTLAAGMAHEINNPLTYVASNLELLDEELSALAAELPEGRLDELDDMVQHARQGAERVRKIVRGLRTFSRADEERRVVLDVVAALELAVHMTANEVRHRARLVKEFSPAPKVLADEAWLGQVFINLLINAAQALPEGHADSNEIRLRAGQDAQGRAFVEVRDTGAGIPAANLGRIFDPFFTTKPVGVGTGLGLSICHGIVSALGGEISVESEVGKGTSFRVCLPPAADAPASERGTPTRPPPLTHQARLLVIDDDPMIGATLLRILKEHRVEAVQRAQVALDRLTAGERFDVILCDLMMPEISGMEFHEHLARIAPDQLDRVVFTTGGAFSQAARSFLDKIPNERVDKPFEVQRLRGMIRRFVSSG